MSDSDTSWTVALETASLICSDPIDDLVEDLERRYHERAEERPDEEPMVALSWLLDRLTDARNRAVKLDRWLTVKEVASKGLGDCHPKTIARKCRNGEIPHRKNSFNGKTEIHVEVVAEMLDKTVDMVQTVREEHREAA